VTARPRPHRIRRTLYAAGGTYTVTLRVTDNQGAQSTRGPQSVTSHATQPAADGLVHAERAALTCNFTSTSSDPDGSIASYSWTFGDGGTSTAANPSPPTGLEARTQ
jgi:PKD repeat protein